MEVWFTSFALEGPDARQRITILLACNGIARIEEKL